MRPFSSFPISSKFSNFLQNSQIFLKIVKFGKEEKGLNFDSRAMKINLSHLQGENSSDYGYSHVNRFSDKNGLSFTDA